MGYNVPHGSFERPGPFTNTPSSHATRRYVNPFRSKGPLSKISSADRSKNGNDGLQNPDVIVEFMNRIATAPHGVIATHFTEHSKQLSKHPLYPLVQAIEPIIFRLFTAESTARNAFLGFSGSYSAAGAPPEIRDIGGTCTSILEKVEGLDKVRRCLTLDALGAEETRNRRLVF